MKRFLRNMFVGVFLSPLIAYVHILFTLVGRDKAIRTVGRSLTYGAKRSLKYWVPVIASAVDFDEFTPKMKSRFWLWRILYDIDITKETKDCIMLRVSNCPFCEVLNVIGLKELSPYVCEGDWAIARENVDKWCFERKHQIGTGDSFCDHTYSRKGNPDVSAIDMDEQQRRGHPQNLENRATIQPAPWTPTVRKTCAGESWGRHVGRKLEIQWKL